MNLSRFSVATINLFNLNLPGVTMYERPGWVPEQYEAKIDWLSRQVKRLDADIIGFQELWQSQPLDDLLARAGLTDTYDVLSDPDVPGGPVRPEGIICAAIVRKGLLHGDPIWVKDFPDSVRLESTGKGDPQAPDVSVHITGFSRPVLSFRVLLRDDQPATTVFVAHLKSKLGEEVWAEEWFKANPDLYRPHTTALGEGLATIRRTAEAVALRSMVVTATKGTDTPVLVLGDLNDGQHSNTMNILTGQPGYLFGDTRAGTDAGLYTAQTLQEYRDTRDVYYTHVHKGLRESLDHILLSEQFYDHSTERLWAFDRLVINNDHLNYDDHKASGTGDHGIVQVYFKHAPARPHD